MTRRRATSTYPWPLVVHTTTICCFCNPEQVFRSGLRRQVISGGSLFGDASSRLNRAPRRPSPAAGQMRDPVRDISLSLIRMQTIKNAGQRTNIPKALTLLPKRNLKLRLLGFTASFIAALMSRSSGHRLVHARGQSPRLFIISNHSQQVKLWCDLLQRGRLLLNPRKSTNIN